MVKVALLGCGMMGTTHANSYKNISDAKLVAVCDISKEKSDKIALINGSNSYQDFETMMQNEEFDVLDVCLPTYMHREYAIKGMEKGKNVFCEKPIALTVEDAEAMLQSAEKNNVKFSVGHVVRFFPAYKNAVNVVNSGKIGVPKLIRTTRNADYPRWSWEGWYNDYTKSGGPMVDLIIHDFDWVVHSFGEVERVFAKSFNGNVPEKEHCLATLRLKNGAIAHVEGSWAYPDDSKFSTSFEVVGTTGQIEFDSLASAGVVKQTNNDGQHNTTMSSPIATSLEPYTAELREFINCVANGTSPIVTGDQAIQALKVALASIESSKTGLPITIE